MESTTLSGDVKDKYAWAFRTNYCAENKVGQFTVTVFQLVDDNWQRSDVTYLVKNYSKAEVQSALESVGFTDVNIHSFYNSKGDLAASSDDECWAYFVCRKPLTSCP